MEPHTIMCMKFGNNPSTALGELPYELVPSV